MSFTPEEIQEILDIYFDVVTTRQYMGARYVPIFGRKDESTTEWDNSAPYEPLTIVTYQGNSYTSRQEVPTGALLTDTDYWVSTGNFNAQVDAYRQDVITLQNNVTALNDLLPSSAFDSVNTVNAALMSIEAGTDTRLDTIEGALPISEFDNVNTVKAAIDAISIEAGDIADLLPSDQFTSVNTVKKAIDDEATARVNADNGLANDISAEVTNRGNADNAIMADVNTINNFLPTGYAQQSPMQPIADYVVESGFTDGWYWRKWFSGLAECWGDFSHSFSITDVYNGVYFANSETYETFPAGLFVDIKTCFIAPQPGYAAITGIEYAGGITTTRTMSYFPYRVESSVSTSAWISVEARGLWKTIE